MLNGEKINIKVIVLDKIYTFAINTFLIWDFLVSNKQYKIQKMYS
jgi:hypothetical protein